MRGPLDAPFHCNNSETLGSCSPAYHILSHCFLFSYRVPIIQCEPHSLTRCMLCFQRIFEPWPSWAPFQPWRSVPYIHIHRPMDYLSVPLTGLSIPQVTRLGQYFLMTFAANVLLTKPHSPQALGHWQYIRPYPDTAGIDGHQTPSCYDLSPALPTTVR